jgi:hypothetical protein
LHNLLFSNSWLFSCSLSHMRISLAVSSRHMVWHTRAGRCSMSHSTPTTRPRHTLTRQSNPASQSTPRWQGRFVGQTSIRWESLWSRNRRQDWRRRETWTLLRWRLSPGPALCSDSLAGLISRQGHELSPAHRTTTQRYGDLACYLPGYFYSIRPSLTFTYVSLYSNVWIEYCRPSLQQRGPSGRGRQKSHRGRCSIGTRLTRSR